MERFEEQTRIEAGMQEFAAPFSYTRPVGIDVDILEPPRGSESARNAEYPKATAAILRLLEEHLYRVPTNKEHMKVASAARKRKISDSEEKASAEKTKSEKMPKMRNAWIDTPTEEEVWQIMSLRPHIPT
jgi:formylmethanofuran dehydrogenase subunit E